DLPDGWTFALSVGGLVPTPPTLNADSTFQDLLDMIGSNNTIADIYTDADGVSSLRLRSATPGTSMASIATRPDAAGGSLDERSTTLAILNRMAPGITSMVALNQGITAANSVEIPDFSHSPSLYTTLNDEQTVTIAVTRGGTTETFTRTFAADETYDAVMAWVNEIEGASMTFNSALGRFVLTTEGTAGEVSMTAVGFEFMGFSNSVDVNPVSTVRIPGSVTSNPVSVRNPVIADGHLGPNTFLHNFFAPGTVSDITIAGRQISINWGDPNADPPTGDTFFTLLMDANRILAGTMPGQAGYGTDTGVRMDVSANGTFSVFVTDPALVYAHNTNPANPNAPANPHTIQIGDGNDNALINLMFGAHNVTVNTPLEQNGTAIENNPILDRPLGSLRILDITIGEGDDAVTTSLILTAGMTHRQAMAAINAVDGLQMTFDPTTSTFTISGTEANTPFRVEGLDLFGFSNVIESDMTDGSRHVRTAQDAVLYYDVGQSGLPSERIVQSSNTFEIHGMRINLTNAVEVGATFTINNERNVDDTFDAIMEFVEQYNNLIRMLDAIHSTPRPRAGNAINGSFFEPLTDEQRAAMSDREIERWEEQARIGLLHRDSDIRHIQQQLRSAMMAPVVLAQETDQFGNVRVTDQIFLFQIGITTVGRDGPPGDQLIGVLRVDEDRLREALENDPERVERLFSDTGMNVNGGSPPRWGTAQERRERAPIVGLGFRLDDVLNNAAEYRDGSLQRRAGYHSGLNVTENMMTRQIRDYDRRISAMQQFLIRRENHFFAMFARMEQAMAQSHAQMDSLFAFMTQ
ncbi:MAG: flagellar filament capping protein FliD, partial [Defluviitaleaceae bacterium]|nr:flagellar filament capping protein FliD [Defluviitaleaceae bacterium]